MAADTNGVELGFAPDSETAIRINKLANVRGRHACPASPFRRLCAAHAAAAQMRGALGLHLFPCSHGSACRLVAPPAPAARRAWPCCLGELCGARTHLTATLR